MKKRRLNADDRPAQQFHALRQLRSLTDTERREVVGLFNENGHGKRTCSRMPQKYGKLLDGIRDVQLPTVDGAMIPAPALSLPVLVQSG